MRPDAGDKLPGLDARPVEPAAAAALLLGGALVAAVVVDPAGRVTCANARARDLLGPGLRGGNLRMWPQQFDLEFEDEPGVCPPERFPPVMTLEGAGDGDTRMRFRQSGWLNFESHVLRRGEERLGAIIFIRDLTERRHLEEILADDRRELARQLDRQAALATIQQAISEPHELMGALQQIVDLVVEHMPATAASIVLWNETTRTFEVSASTVPMQDGSRTARRVRRRGGATRWIVDNQRPLVVPDTEHDPLQANAMLAEEQLRAYAGVPMIDEEGTVIGVLYAMEDAVRVFTEGDIDFLRRLASRATTALGKVRLYEQLRALNETLHARTRELAENRTALEDLVERRTRALSESVERLRAADRMAAIGTLTAGLGHDINNILFPIRCRLDVMDWDRVPVEFRDTLTAVSHATEYLQQLSDGLRLFARDPETANPTGDETDLSLWWEKVQPLLVKTLPDQLSLSEDLPPGLPLIQVAPHRLTQAVLNLVVNAGEAIEGTGTIRVTAAREDGIVRLSVADDGQGMTPEIKSRIFDPFFTTKPRGMSTGLGLSLVHGVIQSSGGATLDVRSAPGRGTEFIMRFRTAEKRDEAGRAPNAARTAVVLCEDRRHRAWIEQYLDEAKFVVGTRLEDPGTELLVAEASATNCEKALGFLECHPGGRVILCGPTEVVGRSDRLIHVPSGVDLGAIRDAILALANPEQAEYETRGP